MSFITTTTLFVLILLAFFTNNSLGQDCKIIVPNNPLSATGLATPYLLASVDPANPCSQIGNGATFVQATVVNTDTGALFVYNPLVIDDGTSPAIAPVLPVLPANRVVALFFGTNADSITLVGNGNTLSNASCVNGITDSIFGQVAYCNAPAFFSKVNSLISKKKITVPALGTAADGFPCPTSRSFFIVDQDQSDNLPTSYLITPQGTLAQNTAANRKRFANSTVLDNGSDEGLIVLVNQALKCKSWDVTDLANGGSTLPSLAMNELLAAHRQPAPVALTPGGDPMVLLANGDESLAKLNAYRLGVDQRVVTSLSQANTTKYCAELLVGFIPRMLTRTTKKLLSAAVSPDTDVGNNLYTFLVGRFEATFQNLQCLDRFGITLPMSVTKDNNGVVMDVDFSSFNMTNYTGMISETSSSSSALTIPVVVVVLSFLIALF